MKINITALDAKTFICAFLYTTPIEISALPISDLYVLILVFFGIFRIIYSSNYIEPIKAFLLANNPTLVLFFIFYFSLAFFYFLADFQFNFHSIDSLIRFLRALQPLIYISASLLFVKTLLTYISPAKKLNYILPDLCHSN